ncbi:hypothetical protein RND71_018258 [Anisodus tanguticus]|uniref:Uncharacterized protein n=1 Tax=Anisodus tanguticus TaxID=243964 RepID=A0AAE1S5A0_9SOLA|nr:hypothetical protein RND71_018258 [Anisodus tanguticus]
MATSRITIGTMARLVVLKTEKRNKKKSAASNSILSALMRFTDTLVSKLGKFELSFFSIGAKLYLDSK